MPVVTQPVQSQTLLLTSSSPFGRAARNHATNTVTVRGYDAVDDRLFGANTTGGQLVQSSDGGASWSGSKGTPASVTYADVVKILRFGSKLYMLAKESAGSGLYSIYSADPQAGSTAFTWSAALTTQIATVTSQLGTTFNCDSSYMYLGDYSNPTGGPSIQRSPDGTTWTTAFARDASILHCHCVKADPYNPGHVWATFGDGIAKTIQKSIDYGVNWNVIISTSAWQGVQISFDANWVYIAGDSHVNTFHVINKSTNTIYAGSPNWHAHLSPRTLGGTKTWDPASVADGAQVNTTVTVTGVIVGDFVRAGFNTAVPAGMQLTAEVTAADTVTVTLVNHSGGAVDLVSGTLRVITEPFSFYDAAYYGVVDPATGVYYCTSNDTSAPGLGTALFYCLKVGRRVEIFDTGGVGSAGVGGGEVFLTPTKVFSGNHNHALLTPTPILI